MEVDFGGVVEEIVTREEFPLEKAREVLKGKTIAVLGYGSQGPGQALNLDDNSEGNYNVIIGQRKESNGKLSDSWKKAIGDGWEEGVNLFSIEEAAERGDIISYLLSDAAQPIVWPDIKEHVDGKTLYVSHGFFPHFSDITGFEVLEGTNVVMVAPKGAGASVRLNYLDKRGINASIAIHLNPDSNADDAEEIAKAMGIAIGGGFLFRTTCEKEVISDHMGERGVLLGGLGGLIEAFYALLRKEGLSPEVAFMKSSEQLTQVILPSIGERGVRGIYAQAQYARELETVLTYQKAVREAVTPVMEKLYLSCKEGTEAKIALESNSKPDYREKLNKELDDMDMSEMWTVGKDIRETTDDRTYDGKITNFALAGAIVGMMEAQYQVLIDNGHDPSEAANETIEELTESLNQFYQKDGISELFRVCSTTAQRGAFDWISKFRKAIASVFTDLDKNYGAGSNSIVSNYTVTKPNMWDAMETVRELRP